jgi:tripartite-type tricarboxylate transporter receptor subunit TctC
MMTKRGMMIALAASAFAAGTAGAEIYPSRPITLVVPFPAGGPTDAVGRIIAEHMRASLGQPVIVENVSGAGGSIGTGRVARALPDGYTIVMGHTGTHAVNGAIYTLDYDVVNDFEPIALAARESLLIVAKKTMPANDLRELIDWLKAHPNQATEATAGVGTPPHIAGVLFQRITGTQLQFVPYRGAAPAMQDLIAGRVDVDIDSPVTALPQIRAGSVKVYAVAGDARLASAPDIPTVDEAGLPGFYVSTWFAIFAPKGLPDDIARKLNAALVRGLADPKARQRIADLGLEVPPSGEQVPEVLRRLQRDDIAKWWPIITAAGIKIN